MSLSRHCFSGPIRHVSDRIPGADRSDRCSSLKPAGFDHRGFTLLELVLAIAILAMVVGVIFGAFRAGISAWQGGERDIVFHQSMRAVAELVFREINSAYPYEITPTLEDDVDSFAAFFGSPDSLLFVSRAPLRNGIGGVSLIELWVDDENGLVLGEAPALFKSFEELNSMDLRNDDQASVISAWVKNIGFRYFYREDDEEEGVWQEGWDPRNSDGVELPLMVEVTLLFEDVREQEIEQVLLVPVVRPSI
jgi:general secretion pathway protein J